MKLSFARSVSVWAALAGIALAAAPKIAGPAYNASAEVRISAVITDARQVPDGALAGQHLTVQPKNGAPVDVYLGPTDFLRFFKTNFPKGAPVQLIGARAGEVILTREVTIGATTITLREDNGAPLWEHWGVVADPATTGGE